MTQAILALSPFRAFSLSLRAFGDRLRVAASAGEVPCWTEYLRETRDRRA